MLNATDSAVRVMFKQYGVIDPLPPTAAVPLLKGDNGVSPSILPFEKGESRTAKRRQGVVHTALSVDLTNNRTRRVFVDQIRL